MRLKLLAGLPNWPSRGTPEAGALPLPSESGKNGFAEAADGAAIQEDVSFSDDPASIVRYRYPQSTTQTPAMTIPICLSANEVSKSWTSPPTAGAGGCGEARPLLG
jgi:hypothetical protein